MSNYLQFEPVRSLAALQGLVQAVIILVAFTAGMSTEVFALVEGVQGSLFYFLSTFVRGAVVPTATLDRLVELSPRELTELEDLQ